MMTYEYSYNHQYFLGTLPQLYTLSKLVMEISPSLRNFLILWCTNLSLQSVVQFGTAQSKQPDVSTFGRQGEISTWLPREVPGIEHVTSGQKPSPNWMSEIRNGNGTNPLATDNGRKVKERKTVLVYLSPYLLSTHSVWSWELGYWWMKYLWALRQILMDEIACCSRSSHFILFF